MKTADIVPGTVYAYQRGSYGSANRVIVLTTEFFYTTPKRWAHPEGPVPYVPARDRRYSRGGYSSNTTGLLALAVHATDPTDPSIEAISRAYAELSLPEIIQGTRRYADITLVGPQYILSDWPTYAAGALKMKQAKLASDVRKKQELDTRQEQIQEIQTLAGLHGISLPGYLSPHTPGVQVPYGVLLDLLRSKHSELAVPGPVL